VVVFAVHLFLLANMADPSTSDVGTNMPSAKRPCTTPASGAGRMVRNGHVALIGMLFPGGSNECSMCGIDNSTWRSKTRHIKRCRILRAYVFSSDDDDSSLGNTNTADAEDPSPITEDTPIHTDLDADNPEQPDKDNAVVDDGDDEAFADAANFINGDLQDDFDMSCDEDMDMDNFFMEDVELDGMTEVMEDDASHLQFFQDNMDSPVHGAGTNVTVRLLIYQLLAWKSTHHVTNAAFTALLKFLQGSLLPSGNIMPPSLYLMTKLIGVPSLQVFERQACIQDHWVWPHLRRSDWKHHVDDQCPKCDCPRFKTRKLANGNLQIKPSKAWYDFGAHNIIADLSQDPQFIQAACAGMTPGERQSPFFASAEGTRYAEWAKTASHDMHDFFDPALNACWEIGGDAGQLFTTALHSTALIVMRCASIPYALKGQLNWSRPLIIISGPGEVKDIRPYFADTIKFFIEHAAGAAKYIGRHHWLTGAYGDAPFRAKLASWLGSGAYLGCGYCSFNGTWLEKHVRFMGYWEEAKQKYTNEGHPDSGFSNGFKLSDQDLCSRGEAAEVAITQNQGSTVNLIGARGKSVFANLPYVHHKNFFVLSIFHALLYGIASDFLNVIFGDLKQGEEVPSWKVHKPGRTIIAKQQACITAISEYGHAHSSVLHKRQYWTMDEYLHFF